MKKTIIAFFSLAIILIAGVNAKAQDDKLKEVKIKTSAVCDMCKTAIEKDMAFEKGVKSAELDLETKMLKVVYRTDKTDLDKIRKAINKVGYDADHMPADPKSYEKLDACCKKDVGDH
jgi:periplasmic mercuric ion binding protein